MNKFFLPAFILGVIILSIPIYIVLSGQKNESQIASDPRDLDKEKVVSPSACVLPLNPKVLQLEYYPKSASNPLYLHAETGMPDVKVEDQERYVSNLSSEYIAALGEASKFHGYENPAAPQFLKYSTYATKKYYQKIPTGYLLHPTRGVYRPDYRKILQQENICNLVDNQGVTEVWMFGYHNGPIEPDESRMSSKIGDFSNSYPKEELLPAEFKLPICKKPYVLYNFNYAGSVSEMLHNRIHQLENVLPRAENAYPATPQNTARGASMFWGNFSENVQSGDVHNYKSACGNAHYTPNWSTTADDYKYSLQNQRQNNCQGWNPDPAKSTYVNASCAQWGCTARGFYIWYLQNMPGYNNGITYKGYNMRNWWESLYSPVEFIQSGSKLYGDSIYNNCVIPGSSPTIAPTTVTPTVTKTVTPKVTPTVTPKTSATTTPGSITCDPYALGNSAGKLTIQDLALVRQEAVRLLTSNKGSCLTVPFTDRTNVLDVVRLRRILAGLESQ